MLALELLVVAVLGGVPDDGSRVDDLVARLGAGRFADREAASTALEGLGRPALPVLRAARGSRDPEIRTRASGLVQRIQSAMLTQATRVQLDYQRVPLTDVVRSLGQQAGFRIVLYPENQRNWKAQRVTLRRSGTVPFWKAIDLLCEAAVLQPFPELNGVDGAREPTFALTDATARTPFPTFDQGPFRVSLQGVRYERNLNFGKPGVVLRIAPGLPGAGLPPRRPVPGLARGRTRIAPVSDEQFSARFLIAAEPRLFIGQAGALKITEATDNRGNSLIAPATATAAAAARRYSLFSTMNGPVLQLQARLHRPVDPGDTIKKLRGVVPLAISSRGPDPLVVPLVAGSIGRRFENPDVEITVHAVRTVSKTVPQTQIELSIRPGDQSDPGDSDPFGDVYRPDLHRQQLEIIDARGRLVSWFPSAVDAENARITLTLPTASSAGSLRELRYYSLTRTNLELPFAFSEIPMP